MIANKKLSYQGPSLAYFGVSPQKSIEVPAMAGLASARLGAILMFVIFFGAFFTSELIPHEGLAHYTPRPSMVGE